MAEGLITIKSAHETEIVINKSRFIASIYPAETEEEAKAFIQSKKKEHHDATHNCSSYIIGPTMLIQKANDDGEPSGTAGVPMLEVLKKQQLHNVVVVVTRYFGGIKLGAGGLIRAYGSAVSQVIKEIGRIILLDAIPFEITLDYDQTGRFEHELQQTDYQLVDTSYTDKVTYTINVIASEEDNFISFLNEVNQGKYDLTKQDMIALPFPYNKEEER
ncbi:MULTISPECIES: YigZ family protein [Mammaliicoccus]|uniref:YigZ family protein n=1 Tax=Mammaliicoccus fleurettii TaxID=150056 RepID=A0ABS5MLN3_9STAP|nr:MULTISPECIES: YigZ family protein [Mammaliicoccus]HCN60261.1 YigZ family protein [Staphylococcus sp.]MBL0846955.1 YigZ family protein [Mammaliicoccus fleurettii]MBO3063291.1 YigZ family protein [Mammaliicoccus fleurettii]MBS3671679.1 YigZ family protein [Mammaliicoccus fleurettii]MBS3696823.1 YigZ family protein [Mammaliicoccus fleurettii]